jgi:hypothetical protein
MSAAIVLSRARMTSLGTGLVLALSLVSTSTVLAQEGPEDTITNLAAAIEAQQIDILPTFFCPEQAAQAAQFDVSMIVASLASLGLPEGVDASQLAAGITLDPEIVSTEVISQTEDEAVVSIVGTLSIGFDPVALSPFIEALLAAQGLEVTPEMVEAMTGMLVGMFSSEAVDISGEVTLVPGETMPWVVCDDLGGSEPSAEPVLEPSGEPISESSPAASPVPIS